jgi:hypothetical protein
MIAKDKLAAEGGSSETKIILGWHCNVRTLTLTLLKHEFIAWSAESQQMISMSPKHQRKHSNQQSDKWDMPTL